MAKIDILVVMLFLFFGLVVIPPSYVHADETRHKVEHQKNTSHQHGTAAHEETSQHDHSGGLKIMGVGFGIISGIMTLISLLTTFTIGMLRRFGKKKINMNLHHYAAYSTVALACIHAIYNLVTH